MDFLDSSPKACVGLDSDAAFCTRGSLEDATTAHPATLDNHHRVPPRKVPHSPVKEAPPAQAIDQLNYAISLFHSA
eukprot:scaffold1836_cov204-Alexandrium_tamarense.AAC.31